MMGGRVAFFALTRMIPKSLFALDSLLDPAATMRFLREVCTVRMGYLSLIP